jgi:MoaA/NifB/PqqE/SkfB family radical SAM enzyme
MVDIIQPIQRLRDAYAVWELTLKCNLACGHCGSRAGDRRDDELSPEEALDLVASSPRPASRRYR